MPSSSDMTGVKFMEHGRQTSARIGQLKASVNRVRGGAAAKRVGKDFEELILFSTRDESGYVMQLERIKNFAKRIPFPGGSKLIEEKSPFDFAGCVMGSGRAVFLDAKSCGEGIASFRANDVKIVKLHQAISLHMLESSGAISGFLVRCERMADYRFIPASRALGSAKPIKWDDPAWMVLGPIRAGYGVPLRKLAEIYSGINSPAWGKVV